MPTRVIRVFLRHAGFECNFGFSLCMHPARPVFSHPTVISFIREMGRRGGVCPKRDNSITENPKLTVFVLPMVYMGVFESKSIQSRQPTNTSKSYLQPNTGKTFEHSRSQCHFF